MGPRHPIERRLFEAVMLVIAGAGCEQSTPSSRGSQARPIQPGVPADAAAVARVVPPDAAVAPDAAPVVVTPPPPLVTALEAQELCKKHKQTTRVDPRKARPLGVGHDREKYGHAIWVAARGVVECRIVRDSRPAEVQIMREPTCCPTGSVNEPCPPGYPIKVQGTKRLVETADLRPDGTLSTSVLAWEATGSDPEPRHNCGRRPAGLQLAPACDAADPEDLGRQLAALAELEAASVPAFERLALELRAHGAPAELVRRARIAMRDEVRHACVMTELAARHGCTPRAVSVPELPVRPLAVIARENAVEGCVREAYGALVATYQAAHAEPALRAAFAAIARDERRHAAFAEDVHAWILSALDRVSRDRVVAARAFAEAELRAGLPLAPSCPGLGVPSGPRAVALFDAYFA